MGTTLLDPPPQPGPSVPPNITLICLLIGLVQGLLLSFLYSSVKDSPQSPPVWPASNSYIFIPLLLICVIIPILLISSLGRLHRRPMVIWMLTTVIILALLGIYDVWRDVSGYFPLKSEISPSLPLCLCLLPGFFIAHVLVLASASDRKRIARYTTYWEASSELFVQVGLSFFFVCAVWLVLFLGNGVIFFAHQP